MQENRSAHVNNSKIHWYGNLHLLFLTIWQHEHWNE